MQAIVVLTSVFCQFFSQAPAESQAPAGDAKNLDREQLESWLADSMNAEISEQFTSHPDQVLAFFDHYLEAGLAMIEKGEPVAKAEESFTKGEQFAAIASQAYSDEVFQKYANSFANWSAEQQKQFRRGQKMFGHGRELSKEGKHAEALAAYLESFDLAKPLGDVWGMAMAQSGIAKSKWVLKEWQMAALHAREAFAINARLRLYDSAIKTFESWVRICRAAEGDLGIDDRPVVVEKQEVPKPNQALGLALAYTEYDLKDYQLAKRIRESWDGLQVQE
jgi:tetratricopeptide (TPR) repeat protein